MSSSYLSIYLSEARYPIPLFPSHQVHGQAKLDREPTSYQGSEGRAFNIVDNRVVDDARAQIIQGTAARALNGVKGPKVENQIKARCEKVHFLCGMCCIVCSVIWHWLSSDLTGYGCSRSPLSIQDEIMQGIKKLNRISYKRFKSQVQYNPITNIPYKVRERWGMSFRSPTTSY